MRVTNAILVLLLALAGFGAGTMLGRRLTLRQASMAASEQTAAALGTSNNPLPSLKARKQTGEVSRTAGQREPMSLAEVEAAIQKAMRRYGGRGYKELND